MKNVVRKSSLLFLLVLPLLFWNCGKDDDSLPEDCTGDDAVKRVQEVADEVVLSSNKGQWSGILGALETEIEVCSGHTLNDEVNALLLSAQEGQAEMADCIDEGMETWISAQLDRIAAVFLGQTPNEESLQSQLCGSNLSIDTLTTDTYQEINQVLITYGFNVFNQSDWGARLNTPGVNSSPIPSSSITVLNPFKLELNLAGTGFGTLSQFEFLELFVNGEEVYSIPIE
jgi:hypothetical protein